MDDQERNALRGKARPALPKREADEQSSSPPREPNQQLRGQLTRVHSSREATPCSTWLRQALDAHTPIDRRIEALEHLAQECHEPSVYQRLHPLLHNGYEEESVRCAFLRLLPNWGDGPMQRSALLQALMVPALRREALQTLDRLAPVTGERQTRLLAELALLRTSSWDFPLVPALPRSYGRDGRVLAFFDERLRTGQPWQRALAATVLCGLGETEAAFRAASDPHARVRQSLALAIGSFQEQRGAGILEQLRADSDVAVAEAAQHSQALLREPTKVIPRPWSSHENDQWAILLQELSDLRLSDPQLQARLAAAGEQRTWLGEAGATEWQIRTLEQRIGRSLPPSYHSFLAASNGFLWPDVFISELYSTETVDWFRVRHADWAAQYRDTYPYLGSCLQVSAVGDVAVILLHPRRKSPTGEWPAYFLASWNAPGITAYASFGEWMRHEIERCCLWHSF